MNDRLYRSDMRCPDCNHLMNRHNRYGCRLSGCMCKIHNPTFDEYRNTLQTVSWIGGKI